MRAPHPIQERPSGMQLPMEPADEVEIVREAMRLTGGHRVGGLGPADLMEPRHAGLTAAQERSAWLDDVARWEAEYRALLTDATRLRSYVLEKLRAMCRHKGEIHGVEQNTCPAVNAEAKTAHLRLRQAHLRMESDCRNDVASVSRIRNAIAGANWSTDCQ